MKNLKLSFALIVAVVAVGFTVASKANFSGKKATTACYEILQLTDAASTPTTYTTLGTENSSVVVGAVSAGIKFLVADPGLTNVKTDCTETFTKYCCIEFNIADPNDPNISRVPSINLGDGQGSQKWVVERILTEEF